MLRALVSSPYKSVIELCVQVFIIFLAGRADGGITGMLDDLAIGARAIAARRALVRVGLFSYGGDFISGLVTSPPNLTLYIYS